MENQNPILGNTNHEGIFTAKNPYIPYQSQHKVLEIDHPPLFCYNEKNELVKGVEGLEVKEGHRIEHTKGWSLITDSEYEFYENTNAQLQPCYIAVQPTEKAAIANTEVSSPAPLSDKSDVEERATVATVEYYKKHGSEIVLPKVSDYNFYHGYIQGFTDQEKLMQGEISSLKLENDRLYIKLNELETLLRNKQE